MNCEKRTRLIINDSSSVQVMLKFWEFLPKTVNNEVKISKMNLLFDKILHVFFDDVSEQISADFINEQIFVNKYHSALEHLNGDQQIVNQSYENLNLLTPSQSNIELKSQISEKTNKNQINFSMSNFDESEQISIYQHNPLLKIKEDNFKKGIKDEVNNQPLKQEISKISQQEFFQIMIDFFIMMIVNQNSIEFSLFWKYVLLKISNVYEIEYDYENESLQKEKKQLKIQTSMQFIGVENKFKEFSIVFLKEDLMGQNFDINNILDKKYHFTLRKTEQIECIGKYSFAQINNLENLPKQISNLIKNQTLFYGFYCIENQEQRLQISPLCYLKMIFEKVNLQNGQIVYKNMLEKEHFSEVDYLKRFDEFFQAKNQRPDYINDIQTCLFQQKIENLKFAINRTKQYEFLLDGFMKDIFYEKSNEQIYDCQVENFDQNFFVKKQEKQNLKKIDVWYWDNLIRYSQSPDYRILLIGKPGTNKKKVAQNISKLLNLKYVNTQEIIENFVKETLEKIQNQNEDENDEENNQEKDIQKEEFEIKCKEEYERLMNGESLSHEFIMILIIKNLQKLIDQSLGFIFVLDSQFFENYSIQQILDKNSNEIYFNQIIEFDINDQSCINRIKSFKSFKINITNEEGEEQLQTLFLNPQQIEEINLNLKRAQILNEPNEDQEYMIQELENLPEEFQEELKNLEKFDLKLEEKQYYQNQAINHIEKYIDIYKNRIIIDCLKLKEKRKIKFLKINIQGLQEEDILKKILKQFNNLPQHNVKEIENGGDFNDLPYADKNENEFDIARKWSFYKNIDPVEFFDKKRIKLGKSEFVLDFYSHIFVFDSEENKEIFRKNPKKYCKEIPQLSNEFNLNLIAMREMNVKEIGQKIAEKYQLELITFESIFENYLTIDSQQNQDENQNEFSKNLDNIIKQLKEQIFNGEPVKIIDLIQIVLFHKGKQFELVFNEQNEEKRLIELTNEKKNPKQKKQQKKAQKKQYTLENFQTLEKNKEQKIQYYQTLLEEENLEKIDKEILNQQLIDIQNQQLVKDDFKGFLFINLPIQENEYKQLEELGINIDKTVYFYNEDITQDLEFTEKVQYINNLEKEYEQQDAILSFLESLEEHQFKKIEFTSKKQMKIFELQIQDFIDPFKIKIDEEIFIKEYNTEEINIDQEPQFYGNYYDYCPVHLVDNNWLIKGKTEFQVKINEKIYLMYDEQSKDKFIENYEYYLEQFYQQNLEQNFEKNKKIFISGSIGTGLNTFTQYCSEYYKCPIINVKKICVEKKLKFIKQNIELKKFTVGFDQEEFEQELNQEQNEDEIIDELDQIIEKFEIDQEEEENLEKEILKGVLMENKNGIFLIDFTMSEQEGRIFKNDFLEIMKNEGFLMDKIIILESNEEYTLERLLNKEKIKENLEERQEQRKQKISQLIQEKKEEIFKEKQENEEEIDFDEIEVNEDDIQVNELPTLDEEIETIQQQIISKRNDQIQFCENLTTILEENKSEIIIIETFLPIKQIESRILFVLKNIENFYQNIFEKGKIFHIQDSENDELTCEKKIEKLIKSGHYQLEYDQFCSFVNQEQILESFDHSLIYKGKIFMFNNQEEKNFILKNLDQLFLSKFIENSHHKLKIFFTKKIQENLKIKIENFLQMKIINLDYILSSVLEHKNIENLEYLYEKNYELIFSQINTQIFQSLNIKTFNNFNNFENQIIEIKNKYQNSKKLSQEEIVLIFFLWQNSYIVQKQGFLVEEFPQNIQMVKLLEKYDIIPDLIITNNQSNEIQQQEVLQNILKIQQELFVKKYSKTDEENQDEQNEEEQEENEEQKLQKQKELEIERKNELKEIMKNEINQQKEKILKEYQKFAQQSEIQYYYSKNFDNVIVLNNKKSVYSNFHIFQQVILTMKQNRINALNQYNKEKPFDIKYLTFSKNQIAKQMSFLSLFELNDFLQNKELNLGKQQKLQFYKKYIYNVQSESLELFYKLEQFLYDFNYEQNIIKNFGCFDKNENLMKIIPKKNLQFMECCSICLSSKKFIPGHSHLSLKVNQQNYLFCNFEHLKQFFKSPLIYTYQKFDIKKLNEYEKIRTSVKSLEEKLIDEIILGLKQILIKKPKYPGLTLKQSFLQYFSIFLKIRNPTGSQQQKHKYQKKLLQFLEMCNSAEKMDKEFLNQNQLPNQKEQEIIKKMNSISQMIQELEINKEKVMKFYVS